MTKLTLTECCMLEVSGELGSDASTRLHRYLSMHPRAQREYDRIKTQFDALRSLPPIELSAANRSAIASNIKRAVRVKLEARERVETSRRRWQIASYLMRISATAAAAVIVLGALFTIQQAAMQRKQMERMARIDKATETLAAYSDRTTQDEQELSDIQTSVAQLKSEGAATIADVDNREMVSVLNVLAVVPADDPDPDTQ
ncbi:MAG TPA: hypothetical protein VM008_11230 [Phycisphaerae bacterium]|nr:hypothetical protein [Phycisphaerae bacterium]